MKKKFICVSFLFCLCACNGNGPATTPSGSITPSPTVTEKVDSPLLFTEFNVGKYVQNRALEIYNSGIADISLTDYAIDIYRNFKEEVAYHIPLEGTIKGKGTYIITYKDANEEIKSKSDLISDSFVNDGTVPMTLTYKNHIIDTFGTIGYVYDYARQKHLVKKKEYLTSEVTFNENCWIRYCIDTYETLGNVDSIDEETLLNGPKLTSYDLTRPFVREEDNMGGGGLIQVGYNYNIDGDTTSFNYGYSLSDYDIYGSNNTRYYGINTPEIAHSSGETSDPYGDEAKSFTTSRLNKAKKYYIQSIEGYSVRETYSRMLGYVWVSEKDNPSISDYYLLNFEIMKNGFARPAFLDFTDDFEKNMTYQGIYLIEFLYQANLYAIKNKLNIYSEN